MTTAHTPTPWTATNSFIVSGDDIVASCITATIDSELAQVNAAHIVKCVNMHDELVEALKFMADSNMTNPQDFKQVARETLKKAGAL